MKKLILSILLFTVINCSGQKATLYDTLPMLTTASLPKLPPYMINIPAIDVNKVNKDTLGVRPIIDGHILYGDYFVGQIPSVLPFYKPEIKLSFHIDSAYLQSIIQELERHGYTLSKLPVKKDTKYKSSWRFIDAPTVSKTDDGEITIEGDYEKAIKDLFNLCEKLNKLYYECVNDRYLKH